MGVGGLGFGGGLGGVGGGVGGLGLWGFNGSLGVWGFADLEGLGGLGGWAGTPGFGGYNALRKWVMSMVTHKSQVKGLPGHVLSTPVPLKLGLGVLGGTFLKFAK